MKALTTGGAVFLLLCAGGTRVEAQGVASSFDQLAVLVKPGDKNQRCRCHRQRSRGANRDVVARCVDPGHQGRPAGTLAKATSHRFASAGTTR